jgi:hypothetical protein
MGNLSRAIKDELNLVRTALPAQNTAANGSAIDLGNVPLSDDVHFSLLIPATPSLADGQTITGKIQDSADGVTFADLVGVGTLVVTGAGGVGAAQAAKVQRTPLACRRYVRAVWTASATAGDNTAVSGEFALTF